VEEHRELNLLCTASGGNPDIYTYRWMFVSQYGDSEQPGEVGSEQTLTVSEVFYYNAGIYSCEANNIVGSSTSSQNVSIRCKYSISDLFLKINQQTINLLRNIFN